MSISLPSTIKRPLVAFPVTIVHETEKAYLFDLGITDSFGRTVNQWFPKTQAQYDEETRCAIAPRWLAEQKGLTDADYDYLDIDDDAVEVDRVFR